MYSIRKRNSCVKTAQLSRNGFHYTLSGSYAWNCWCQKLQKARVVKGAVLTNIMEKNSIKLIRKATKESMLFSSISNWILKFFVVSRYVNTKNNSYDIIITDYKGIIMVNFIFIRKPNFSFKKAYLSGIDSQYTP